MGMPHQPPPTRRGSGHGPFGDKAFRGALVGCGVMVIAGLPMLLLGSGAMVSVGTSFLVLGVLGLATGAAGLLAERRLGRRPPAPPDVHRWNGRGPSPPDVSRVDVRLRERP